MKVSQSHFSSTRKIQRIVTKYLKNTLSLEASSKGSKQPSGWQTSVKGVSVSKPCKSSCMSLSGRIVPIVTKLRKPVLTLNSKGV